MGGECLDWMFMRCWWNKDNDTVVRYMIIEKKFDITKLTVTKQKYRRFYLVNKNGKEMNKCEHASQIRLYKGGKKLDWTFTPERWKQTKNTKGRWQFFKYRKRKIERMFNTDWRW